MTIFIFAFIAMAMIIAGMAVGAILQNKPLQGSCGGLNSIGMKEGCEVCGGDDDECKKEQERQQQLAGQADLAYDATRR
ncbi:(Na+)-NQR maturation NqrM [Microbulbifer halophilus]|uniref:(Na+)-NQR maturation NqrM n=1 Tax=Microbulbifer halophilus TaxID=453963 RepID=A0ABW5EGA9_9GAMM|nr:(Na+)-NQR maturation NqrM [Microbulbifer halophilus]MCW8128203.1 (Na+)-NQR maturation NqrM [Microbulbifer halophilus]